MISDPSSLLPDDDLSIPRYATGSPIKGSGGYSFEHSLFQPGPYSCPTPEIVRLIFIGNNATLTQKTDLS
jgi:hypothetical protein